jgi:hypothetical protein
MKGGCDGADSNRFVMNGSRKRKEQTMKPMVRQLTLGALTVLLALTAPPAKAAPPHTGIQGRSRAELHPTPIEVAPGIWIIATGWLAAPAATSITVYSARTGREITRFATGGRPTAYTVSLPPDNYLLVPDVLTLGPDCFVRASPVEVTVHPRQFTTQDIVYRTNDRCAESFLSFRADPGT